MTRRGRRRLPVVFNGQFFCHRLKTGVQRFALETLRALDTRLADPAAAVDLTVLVPPDAEPDASFSNIAIVRCGRRTGYDWEQIDLRFASGRRILVSPCNSGPLFKRNQIPVIHDTVVLDHPEWFDEHFVRQCSRVLPWLCRWSKRIVTVSEFSRGRISATTGVSTAKIDVVPNGVSASFAPPSPAAVAAMRSALSLDRPYVLTVGSIEPRKNLVGLLAAWRRVESSFPDHELVVAGGKDSIFAATATEAPPPRARLLGYVDDGLLPALYGAADVFAYPSLYEGFGLPPVEAMACGVPVITSRATAMEEICGPAATYFDPSDPASIALALTTALHGGDGRARSSAAGRARAASYTWDRTAAGILAAIGAVAGEGAQVDLSAGRAVTGG